MTPAFDVTLQALGRRFDSGTLSPLIRRLEGAGLLERRRDQTDERLVTVHVTEAGRALREKALTIPGSVVDALGVEVTDLEELHRALTRVNSAAVAAVGGHSAKG